MSTRLRLPLVLAACTAAVLCGSQPLSAQVALRGRVLDDVTEQPLAGARVLLLGRYNKVVDYAVTEEDGRFSFKPHDDKWVRVEVSAVGYAQTTSPGLWMIRNRDFAALEIRLAPNVVLLAPLEIVALSPPRTSPVLENVEYRRTRGFGIQITRQDIEERQPLYISDILVELPGVYAERRGSRAGGRSLRMGRALPGLGGGECPVQVFLDGMQATRENPGGDVLVDDLVSPLDVEVIEVFRGLGSVPPEFLTPHARCGVIAVWTKRSLEPLP